MDAICMNSRVWLIKRVDFCISELSEDNPLFYLNGSKMKIASFILLTSVIGYQSWLIVRVKTKF